jgi:hypothetical protein
VFAVRGGVTDRARRQNAVRVVPERNEDKTSSLIA